MIGKREAESKRNSKDDLVTVHDFVLTGVEPFRFGVETGAHLCVQLGDFVAMDVVVGYLPEGNKLAPEKEKKLFGPEFPGAAFGVWVEDGVMLILEDAPLGTAAAGEKRIPTDGVLSLVGRRGRVGLIGSGDLTGDEIGAV